MNSRSEETEAERSPITDDQLEKKIADLLDVFYQKRVESLKGLKLQDKLKAKNPYLFRAIGISDASEIVAGLLDAHISSSDETLFGNEIFEPLAKWAAAASFKGDESTTVQISGGEGSDIQISSDNEDQVIAIKSGPKVFNAQSKARQRDDFNKIERILKKNRRLFHAIVGYAYGNKKQKEAKDFTEIAGQQLWMHLTGDRQFYVRIIVLMRDKPAKHRPDFKIEYDKAKNRFTQDFLASFSKDGEIDWEKITKLVSEEAPERAKGAKKGKSTRKSTPKRAKVKTKAV